MAFAIPNLSQQVYWLTLGNSGHQLDIYVQGYQLPNGGE